MEQQKPKMQPSDYGPLFDLSEWMIEELARPFWPSNVRMESPAGGVFIVNGLLLRRMARYRNDK